MPRAMEKRLDLGYEGPEASQAGLRIHGHPLLIRELIRNLVDNALLYTPGGGTITVRVVEDPFGQVCVLQVEDSGPGIAESEREQVRTLELLARNIDQGSSHEVSFAELEYLGF